MIASLYAGISGLSANATAMTVIGDNIANVNTTAFKGNRSHFANILSTSLGGESATGNVGRGVEFWGTNAQWTQGSLENSSNPTDLAINGKGFFMVQDAQWRELLHPRRQLHLRQGRLPREPGRVAAPGLSDRCQWQRRRHHVRVHPGRADLRALGHDRVQLRHQPERRGRRQRHLHDRPDGLRLAGQCRARDVHVHENRQQRMVGGRFGPGHRRQRRDHRRGRQHAHHLQCERGDDRTRRRRDRRRHPDQRGDQPALAHMGLVRRQPASATAT